jgi:NAD+ synthase (glutamine-hydrolysing)
MKTKLILHQTHQTLVDFDSIFNYLKKNLKDEGLHLFPELFLTGYPLQDIVLQRPFIERYIAFLNDIEKWLLSLGPDLSWKALIGGIHYSLEKDNLPNKIQNVIFEAVPGIGLKKIYAKRLLPNYDIFDEQKYFSPGEGNCFYEYRGHTFGLQICEDMWASSFHHIDPCKLMVQEMQATNLKLSGLINLSASPFDYNKKSKRRDRAKSLSHLFKCPFVYVNRVGGEDEILFDGSSFILSGDKMLLEFESFKSEVNSYEIDDSHLINSKMTDFNTENTWEGLFSPRINQNQHPATLKEWTNENCKEVLKALQFGFQEYAKKSGFSKFLVALSGGIDSTLVLAIIKLCLKPGQELEAIYMPSIYSSPISTQLSEELCQNLGIKLSYFPIKFLHAMVKNSFEQSFSEKFEGLTDENVQSRLRGLLLYTRSNQTGAMVINTSNKSELAVGYSTQYGDSVGAISLIGDLYKTEVYNLCHYINRHFGDLIPEGIIHRGPSAELRQDQLDQDSLPPYSRLDPILEGILSYRLGKAQLIELGFSEAEVTKVLQLYLKSEYKRTQFCPIIKVKAKSFGFGYRIPISKSLDYQLK